MNEITRINTGVTNAPHSTTATPIKPDNLEALLSRLLTFGAPRLHYINPGWYCAVEMNTTTPGADFTVASDFKQPTATAAAQQVLSRVEAALRQRGA